MITRPMPATLPAYSSEHAAQQARACRPAADPAQGLNAAPYSDLQLLHRAQHQSHQYQRAQPDGPVRPHHHAHPPHLYEPASSPRSRPSEPSRVDAGVKPSLPSISNLLGIADGDRSSHQASSQGPGYAKTRQLHQVQQPHDSHYPLQHSRSGSRDPRNSTTHPRHDCQNGQLSVPPTPPFRTDSTLEGTHSPSSVSTGSISTQRSYFTDLALNNVEPHNQRPNTSQPSKQGSALSHPNAMPYSTSPRTNSTLSQSPEMMSVPIYSPNVNDPPVSLRDQQPLPSGFPPSSRPSHSVRSSTDLSASSTTSASTTPTTAAWPHHHHYINASSQASFAQSQDRYICQTCQKTFSRPSSLKIHSHSHTGEKPFKCPYQGCGKSFSVRSNMRRHERGCHNTGVSIPYVAAPRMV